MQPDPPVVTDATGVSQAAPAGNPSSPGSPDSDGAGAAPEPIRTSAKIIAVHVVTIHGLREALPGLIAGFAWLGVSGGVRSFGIAGILAALIAAIIGVAALNWYRFSYQVANRQLIISQGIFSRRVRTIPVDRIRAIDSQVGPLHRLLGLARLKIEAAAAGTGQEEALIDGLPTQAAAALRDDLLRSRRRPASNPAGGGAQLAGRGHPGQASGGDGGECRIDEPFEDVEYSRARASWLLYAPLVGSYLAIPLAGLGFLSQFADDIPESWTSRISLDPSTFGMGQFLLTGLALIGLLVIGAVLGAVVLNWRFLLVKRGDLMVSERGLFTRRTVSVEIPRIRGYMLSEGIGMRLVRAARLTALITGVSNANSRSQLLPLGPRTEAVRVAERAVRKFHTPLRRHPIAALRRRLLRSIAPGAVVLLAGAVLAVPAVILVGLVLVALGIPLGIDGYRSLGHASDGTALALRSGSFIRQTTVLERRAVVGWKIQQSYFQRRAGLATVTALVGAGTGAYSAFDAARSDALDLAVSNGGRWAQELLPAAQSSRPPALTSPRAASG